MFNEFRNILTFAIELYFNGVGTFQTTINGVRENVVVKSRAVNGTPVTHFTFSEAFLLAEQVLSGQGVATKEGDIEFRVGGEVFDVIIGQQAATPTP